MCTTTLLAVFMVFAGAACSLVLGSLAGLQGARGPVHAVLCEALGRLSLLESGPP